MISTVLPGRVGKKHMHGLIAPRRDSAIALCRNLAILPISKDI